MNFKEFFKFNKSKSRFKFSTFGKSFLNFWMTHQQLIFIAFFLIIMSAAAYFWYKNLYGFSWNEEEKKQYINSQGQQASLKESELVKVLSEVEKRRNIFQEEPKQTRDIFKPYDGMK
jgi:hypothetical protein